MEKALFCKYGDVPLNTHCICNVNMGGSRQIRGCPLNPTCPKKPHTLRLLIINNKQAFAHHIIPGPLLQELLALSYTCDDGNDADGGDDDDGDDDGGGTGDGGSE